MAINVNSIIPSNFFYKTTPVGKPKTTPVGGQDFATIFDSAKDLLKETNRLEQAAENEALKFTLGQADNAHDMMIAAQEAAIALQYTNAIRTNVIQSYQTIMNMQI